MTTLKQVAERGWNPQIVTVRWNRQDRLGIKLGRVRQGYVQIALPTRSQAILVDYHPQAAVRPADLIRVDRTELYGLLTLMVEQGILAKCDRLSTMRAYDREWREAERALTKLEDGHRQKYRMGKAHFGAMPGAVADAIYAGTVHVHS